MKLISDIARLRGVVSLSCEERREGGVSSAERGVQGDVPAVNFSSCRTCQNVESLRDATLSPSHPSANKKMLSDESTTLEPGLSANFKERKACFVWERRSRLPANRIPPRREGSNARRRDTETRGGGLFSAAKHR